MILFEIKNLFRAANVNKFHGAMRNTSKKLWFFLFFNAVLVI